MNYAGSITITECLDEIDSGKQFSIGFVTANASEETGGEIKRYTNCTVANVGFNPHAENRGRRNANNDLHGIKKIRKANGEQRSIHKLLIVEFNNRRVLL